MFFARRLRWLQICSVVVCCAWSGFGSAVDAHGADQAPAATGGAAADAPSAARSQGGPAVEFKDKRPVVTAGMLFAPTFHLKETKTSGGIMFAARLPDSDRPLLVSAMHLFGPATGMDEQLSVDEITELWVSVDGVDSFEGKKTAFTGTGLGLPGASAAFEPSKVGDVIVFIPKEIKALKPITLAADVPKSGDVVWLLSHTSTNEALAHRAVCLTMVHDSFLVYQFDEPLALRGTSGGPIINERGHVVGVQRGGGEQEGKTLGAATLAGRFLPAVKREVEAHATAK